MKTWLAAAPLLVLLHASSFANPDIQTPDGRSQERQRIESQRSIADAEFDARDQECQTRFIVTSCRNQVRLDRIRSQDEFRRQESILNRLDRQAAALKQQQKVDEKVR